MANEQKKKYKSNIMCSVTLAERALAFLFLNCLLFSRTLSLSRLFVCSTSLVCRRKAVCMQLIE